MEQITLNAETGRKIGSGPSKQLRVQNKVPAVVYGAGAPPQSITVDRVEFRRVLNSAGSNAVITLNIDGSEQQLTFVRDLQIHPRKDRVQHIDFLRVDSKQRVNAEVQVVLVGEAEELAREGGIVEQLMSTIFVDAPVIAIPRSIEVDIAALTVDSPIRFGDINLGEGVTSDLEDDALIVVGQLSRAAVSGDGTEADAEADAAAEG